MAFRPATALALAAALWSVSARADRASVVRIHVGPSFWQQGTLSCASDYDLVACSPINFRSLELGSSFTHDWLRAQLDGVVGVSPEGGIATHRLIAITTTVRAILPFTWGDLGAGPRGGAVVLSDFPTDPGKSVHQLSFAIGGEGAASFNLGKYLALEPAAAFVWTPVPYPSASEVPVGRYYGSTWWIAGSLRLHVKLAAVGGR